MVQEQIETKIREWQQELDRLTARRGQLAQAVSECDVSIQRHVGAITGAQELLALAKPRADEPEPEGETQPERESP